MEAVSTLIFNSLAEGRGITLPEIGSLWIKPFPAKEIRPGRITPPGRQVVFSVQESANQQSIISEIAVSGGITEAEANEIYGRWKDAAISDKIVIIEGVGKIEHGHFKPTVELEAILNPFGHEAIKLKRTGRGTRIFLTILVLVIIIAAGAGYLWYRGMISIPGVPAAEEFMAPKTEMPATEPQRPAGHTAQPVAADSVARDTTGGRTAEDSIARSLMSAAAIQTPEAGNAKAQLSGTSQAVVSGTTQNNPAVATDKDIYHVVGGVYSTEANADKFIASSRAKNDTLHYAKIPTSRGRIIVSIYQSNDREDALRTMRRLNDSSGSLWIHTQRSK